jgi:DtxR family Mn-dependent transcriptional regulator
MVREPSVAEEDYLKQIYLEQEEKGYATTQALATRLGVKPASVTAMIKRLAEDPSGPYVRHTPYHGVELTESGRAVALETLRHHRLLELFLSKELDVPWDRVHDEAERLEHVLSEDLEERIAARLGEPAFDPHGDPIPTRELTLPRRDMIRLVEMTPGSSGVVARIEQQDQPALQYLETLGLMPGATVTVEAVAPYGGVVTVRVRPITASKAATHTLGRELAGHILVTKVRGDGR